MSVILGLLETSRVVVNAFLFSGIKTELVTGYFWCRNLILRYIKLAGKHSAQSL